MPWQENVCSVHEEQHHSVTTRAKLLFISKAALSLRHSSHTYTNTHTVPSFLWPLLPLCAPHAIWTSGCWGMATHDPRGSHQDKRPLRWERGGRKGLLKHKRTYAINNTLNDFSNVTLTIKSGQYSSRVESILNVKSFCTTKLTQFLPASYTILRWSNRYLKHGEWLTNS